MLVDWDLRQARLLSTNIYHCIRTYVGISRGSKESISSLPILVREERNPEVLHYILASFEVIHRIRLGTVQVHNSRAR